MHPTLNHRTAIAALGLLLGLAPTLEAATVFEDSFTTYAPDGPWQAYGSGVPDLALTVVTGIGDDGSSLRMGTAPGIGGEELGIQTATSFSTAGIRLIRVTARVRPLNQTGAGDGGASDASAGLKILGVSGAFAQASAGANRPVAPDWADFYTDSFGEAESSAAFLHFPPNDPAGGAEVFRTFVLEITANGTRLTTLSVASLPLANTPFDVLTPDLTLDALGASFTVALFQQRSDDSWAPENTFGDFDRVTVEIETGEEPPLALAISQGGNIIDDSKPLGTPHPGVNDGAAWTASNTDGAAKTRNGVMQFVAANTNLITLAGNPDFDTATGTIMFWIRSAGTAGGGSEGALLFDRRPAGVNGAPGAVILQTDTGNVRFQAASGTGIGGYPNEVSQRINLDGDHLGYRMRTSDLSGTVYGIELASPLDIPAAETSLEMQALVQNRSGGQYPARLVLRTLDGARSLTASLNEASGGHMRQFVTFGTGGGGAFDQASDDYLHSPYNFYQVLVTIDGAGTTVDLLSEDLGVLIHTFAVPEFTLADLAGSSVQLSVLQAANASGATEALLDHLTVTSAVAGFLLDDAFDPGAGPGDNWVAASGSGAATDLLGSRKVDDNRWHHVAVAYDQGKTGTTELFIDGTLDVSQANLAAWTWTAAQGIEWGRSHDPQWRAFDGSLDDLRLYSRKLTSLEIAQAASADALVDPSALTVRFNFDTPPSGLTLTWPGGGSLETTTDVTISPVEWTPVPRALSPFYVNPAESPLRFYRVLGL